MDTLFVEDLKQQIMACDEAQTSALISLMSMEKTLHDLEASDTYRGKNAITHYKSAIRRWIKILDRLAQARYRARLLLISWQNEDSYGVQ